MRFPVWQEPKVDGVRGLYLRQNFSGRSLKLFGNRALTKFWSASEFFGIDGELWHPQRTITSPDLCRMTSGLTRRINDPMVPNLMAFDLVSADVADLPYARRYEQLAKRLRVLQEPKLSLVEYVIVRNMDDVEKWRAKFIDLGYEGSILRDPTKGLKEGRSGDGLEFWRIKDFIDFEFTIDELIEAQENTNEAKTNPLGRTERSSAKAGKVGKGMIGMLRGRMLKDVVHNGMLLFKKGHKVDCGPGELTHAEREEGWANPRLYVGKIGKGKTFPHGVLDKPRMPTFICLRGKEDL
jgi:DNA ligase-1